MFVEMNDALWRLVRETMSVTKKYEFHEWLQDAAICQLLTYTDELAPRFGGEPSSEYERMWTLIDRWRDAELRSLIEVIAEEAAEAVAQALRRTDDG
ncbi:MAG: hypothetical protein IRY83_14940 [Chloroflexi bacterium]|nr:hypothetical protein [Chloroflexota bacterium]